MNTAAIGTSRMSATAQAAAAITSEAAEPAAPTLLPDPVDQLSSSADVVAQIAAMLIHSLREDRNAARLKSAAEELTIRREGEQRVAKLHEKADAIRTRGLWDGIGQIGGGALAGGGAAMQLGGDKWQKAGKIFEGSKAASSGIGSLGATRYEARQTDLDADAEHHRANADLASKRQQQLDDDVRDARELLSKVADFLRECNGARNSARQQAASIRA